MFLVTTFVGGQTIESIATADELFQSLRWVEGDSPILEVFNGKIVELTMTIRRATQEEVERINV